MCCCLWPLLLLPCCCGRSRCRRVELADFGFGHVYDPTGTYFPQMNVYRGYDPCCNPCQKHCC